MSKELQKLEDLFKHLLQDMYYAEHEISKALPKMAKKATNENLQAEFEQHLEETKDQTSKLEQVFEVCGYEKEREKCEAIEGLIEEGEGLMKEAKAGAVLDSALIAAAQKIKHYEIASYGTLCYMAKKLGQTKAAELLHEILEQEKATDKKLSKLCDEIEEKAMDNAA
ncbi:MAG: ferritin-like domain-containing protein [Sneathiella sp.]